MILRTTKAVSLEKSPDLEIYVLFRHSEGRSSRENHVGKIINAPGAPAKDSTAVVPRVCRIGIT